MSDEVKFIFKTLIKVPVIVFVCYLILNVLLFSFTYFKLLGMSYVVMQTVVENNYLPNSEKEDLLKYIDTLNTNTNGVGSVTGATSTTYDANNEVVSYAGLIVNKVTNGTDTGEVILHYKVPLEALGSGDTAQQEYIVLKNGNDLDVTHPYNSWTEITNAGYSSSYKPENSRRQYGNKAYVGVYARYQMVWPLLHNETMTLSNSNDYINSSATYLDESGLNAARSSKIGKLNIRITYVVPGLKYYPDLTT
jgi:hypothetical protein